MEQQLRNEVARLKQSVRNLQEAAAADAAKLAEAQAALDRERKITAEMQAMAAQIDALKADLSAKDAECKRLKQAADVTRADAEAQAAVAKQAAADLAKAKAAIAEAKAETQAASQTIVALNTGHAGVVAGLHRVIEVEKAKHAETSAALVASHQKAKAAQDQLTAVRKTLGSMARRTATDIDIAIAQAAAASAGLAIE